MEAWRPNPSLAVGALWAPISGRGGRPPSGSGLWPVAVEGWVCTASLDNLLTVPAPSDATGAKPPRLRSELSLYWAMGADGGPSVAARALDHFLVEVRFWWDRHECRSLPRPRDRPLPAGPVDGLHRSFLSRLR